jgi:hypothetical protein
MAYVKKQFLMLQNCYLRDFFFVFLYRTQGMSFLHKLWCIDIECLDVHVDFLSKFSDTLKYI